MRKRLTALSALTLALLIIITSCSSKSLNEIATEDRMQNGYAEIYEDADIAYDYGGGFTDYKEEAETMESITYTSGNTSYAPQVTVNRKIIYTSSYNIQTTEFDSAISALEKLCSKYGAYYESSETYGTKENANRNGSFTVRIPVQNYNAFKSEAGSLGVITRSSENNRDVTEIYVDTEARLQSAKVREERLLEILANADTLDDVLLLEKELADVRYEIESMSGSLRKYDSLINYSTIEIYIREVIEPVEIKPVPKTFAQKVITAITDGFEDFARDAGYLFIDILYNLPGIIIFVVTIVIVCVIIKKMIRKRKNKNEKIAVSDENTTDNKENLK